MAGNGRTVERDGSGGLAPNRRSTQGAVRRRRSRRDRSGGNRWMWGWVLAVLVVGAGGGYWAYQARWLDGGSLDRLSLPGVQAPASRELTLYFADPRWSRLTQERRRIPAPDGAVATLRAVVTALSAGSQEGHAAVLPTGLVLRGAYLGRDGLAVLDFDAELERFDPGGASGEALSVFAVVNSVAANLPDVTRVQLLIGGTERETLAGHVKISEPLAPDPQWFAPPPG